MVLNSKGIHNISVRWHPVMARITIVLALLHGTLAILARF